MFVVPRREQPNFLLGKLRDLGTLALIGLTLMVSVEPLRCRDRLLRADPGLGRHRPDGAGARPCCSTSSATCWRSRRPPCCCCDVQAAHRRVARPARRAGRGAPCSARSASRCSSSVPTCCSRRPRGNPAFQAFGVALILLIWINYFSRLVMYSAAWAYTLRRRPGAAHRRGQARPGGRPGHRARRAPRSRPAPGADERRRRRPGPGWLLPHPRRSPGPTYQRAGRRRATAPTGACAHGGRWPVPACSRWSAPWPSAASAAGSPEARPAIGRLAASGRMGA